jgi:hypothetical protein
MVEGQNTMSMGVEIPWARGIKIPWVSGSIYRGQGVKMVASQIADSQFAESQIAESN